MLRACWDVQVNSAAAPSELLARPATYSIEKARRLLGYAPAVDLAEGMRRTEAWAREKGLIGARR